MSEKFIRRLVLFLLRSKYHLRIKEPFIFDNQKGSGYYVFTKDAIMKYYVSGDKLKTKPSNISVNWLLNPRCTIVRGGVMFKRLKEGKKDAN